MFPIDTAMRPSIYAVEEAQFNRTDIVYNVIESRATGVREPRRDRRTDETQVLLLLFFFLVFFLSHNFNARGAFARDISPAYEIGGTYLPC